MTTATTNPTAFTAKKNEWRALFGAALKRAARKSGLDTTGLQWESCDTDRTWGDRVGLVFWGASDEVNERAARFFEAWAGKHLRALGVVGGYETQESIAYAGKFTFSRFSNGAQGWHRVDGKTVPRVAGSSEIVGKGQSYEFVLTCEEVRLGHATSYVYYPCAD